MVAALAVGPWRLLLPVLVIILATVLRPRPSTAVLLALTALPTTALLRRVTAGESGYVPSDPLAMLVVLAALPAFVLLRGRAQPAPGSGWLAGYLGWLFVTAGVASSGSIATRITGLLLVAVPCGIGYVIARGWAGSADATALRSFLVLLLPVSAYGVAQFFLAPRWDMAWLDSVKETLNSVGQPEARAFRVWGTMEAPLSFALYLGLGLLAIMCWMVARRGSGHSALRTVFSTAVVALALTALILTSVRSVLFVLPVLLLLLAMLGLLPVGRVQAVLFAALIAAAMYAGVNVLGLAATGSTGSRYDISSLAQDQSVQDRLLLLPRFLEAASNPVGTGPGTAGVAASLTDGGTSNGIDNGYLSLLQEGGVIRLVLFCVVVGTAFIAAVRSARRRPRDPAALFTVMVLAYYIALEGSSDVSSGVGSLVLWICVGSAFGRAGADALESPPTRSPDTVSTAATLAASPAHRRSEPAPALSAHPATAPADASLVPSAPGGTPASNADAQPTDAQSPSSQGPTHVQADLPATAAAASAVPTPPPVDDAAPDDHRAGERPGKGRARGSVRSVAHVVLAGGVLPLVSLATGPLLARTLGLEGRGHMSAVLAPVALIPYMLSVGLGDGASYLVARRGRHPADVALVMGALGALTGAVGALVLWLLAPVLLADYPEGIGLLRALGLTLVPAMALANVQATRTGEGRYDLLARERWFAGLSRLIALGGLALAGSLTVVSGAWAQVLLLVTAQCVALTGLRRPRTRWREVKEIAREGTRFGSRAWGGELAVFVILRLDQTVMLPLAGAGQLGLYVVAVSLAEVPTMLLGDLRRLLLSEVAVHRDAALAARACRLSVVAVGLPVLCGMALTPLVIPLLFGSDFSGAVPMAVVLLGGSVFSGLNLFLGGSISALGSPGTQSRAQLASLVVAVLGIGLIVPFGGLGAAVASLLAYLAGTIVMVAVFRRLTALPVRAVVVPRREDVVFLLTTVTGRFRRSS